MQRHQEKGSGGSLTILDALFIGFCFFPFLFPNPIVKTNIQPYAAIFGVLVILRQRRLHIKPLSFESVGAFTFLFSLFVLLFGDINISAFRALYNYMAVAIVPWATILIVRKLDVYPERLIKAMILGWFAVAAVQFFVSRGFMTQLIGGVRWSEGYRGVVGLASEPSFFGIACSFFLHMVQRFQKDKLLFIAIALVMGVLFAQSTMGILFIVGFLAIYLLEKAEGWKGIVVWIVAVVAVLVFASMMDTVFAGTRLGDIYNSFMGGGMDEVLKDSSADTRLTSLSTAISNAFDNLLFPLGFQSRIGSGYGGFLCELGFFAIPIMIMISRAMAETFVKKHCKVLYFIIITILLFNNTQIGNPMLLFVVGSNVALMEKRK